MSDETAVERIAAVLARQLCEKDGNSWDDIKQSWRDEYLEEGEKIARVLLASSVVVGLPVEPSPILDKLYRQQGLDLDVALYAVAQRQAEGAAT
jgi:hypothetical protein